MNTSAFLQSFFDFLNREAEYAVLRNFEGLPERHSSRDIDMAIEKKDFLRLRSRLVRLVEDCGWHIVTYLNSDRLITWVCGVVHKDLAVEVVQFDFFYHTSVYGIRLLENKDILSARKFNGFLYHATKEYEFLDKYLYDRAVGAAYPEKYTATRAEAERSEVVAKKIRSLFGVASLAECDKAGRGKLLFSALLFNLKTRPLGWLCGILCFLYAFVKNFLCSNTGFSIGFTGPDGSGKTTVIDLMMTSLGDVFRKAHTCLHFRPTLFGNLGEVAYSAGFKKTVDRNYSDPHRGRKTGVLSSLARLLYYAADYVLGYWLKVKTVTRITRLVIFDRYYTDIICDSRRSRIYLSPRFLYWFGRLFIPSLDYNILLTADAETILARKHELDAEGIQAINAKIDYLANKQGYKKVLNEGRPEAAVAEILSHVFEAQHRKNLKRLGCGFPICADRNS